MGAATQFAALESGWQVVVIAALIMIIGYLILSASSSVLDTLAGRTWSGSLFELGGRTLRKSRRDALRKHLAEMRDRPGLGTEPEARAARRLRTRFAPHGTRPSASTELGDALIAADAGVEDRYGLRLAALWEPLRTVVDPEKPAAIAAADEKSSLDLMANLTFVFGLFGLEAVTLYSIWDRDGSVLLAASAIAIAYVCYRVTVTRALSWIDAINTVVVLYRDELLKEIGARDVLDEAGQKRVLSDLSAFVLFNSATKPIFEAEVAGPELVCSANVSADLQDAVVDVPPGLGPSPEVRQSIKYVLVVTRKPDGWAPVSAQILLGEPRLARMRDPRVDTAVGATGTVIQASGAGAADALLWQIDDLGRAEARTLVFELDRWRFAVDNGLQLTVEEDDRKPGHFDVEIFNPAVAAITGATLDVFHADDGRRRLLRIGEAITAETAGPRGRRWTLATIPPDGSVVVGFDLKEEKA